ELRRPSRRAQGQRDEVGQSAEKITLAIIGIAGLEGIVMAIAHQVARRAWQRSNLRTTSLCQPSLAPPVMLALTERFAPAFGDAEIELLDVLVLAQRLGLAVEHHAAVFEHVAVTRVFQCHAGVLLGEQE